MTHQSLEFDKIKAMLAEFASTDYGKEKIAALTPILDESKLRRALKETDSAATIIAAAGSPHLPNVTEMRRLMLVVEKEGLLLPAQLERVRAFAASCRRLKDYLKKAETTGEALAFSGAGLSPLEEAYLEINRCICGDDVTLEASTEIASIRRSISALEGRIKAKAEEMLRTKKSMLADNFVSLRNGHYTLPVKKEYKNQVPGSVIAVSSTGGTCFIEPVAIAKLAGELESLHSDELMEKQRILYTLTALISGYGKEIGLNIEIAESLDFAFAKGKLSAAMGAVSPVINTKRFIRIRKGRHPLISKDTCVPLDFEIGKVRGIVITGPNTGGKTVALKLVGLFSLMGQSGLHLPAESAELCMNSNVLCDIGDGQNISANLSTFSAHITNVIGILEKTGRDSLVLLDELGSGTDPAEGMGLAVAILEELRRRECLFIATTHYVEVKSYALHAEHLINARMTFDKATLRPEYRLVIGEAGESCAFDIAKRLGLPGHILAAAADLIKPDGARSGGDNDGVFADRLSTNASFGGERAHSPNEAIRKTPKPKVQSAHALSFVMGDSVMVYPDKETGIVYKPADENGLLVVQIKGKKQKVNHKRVKLKVAASELYPADYDFSIVFDSVENRKARHQMGKRHREDLEIRYEDEI